jgi:hypothetical protein
MLTFLQGVPNASFAPLVFMSEMFSQDPHVLPAMLENSSQVMMLSE